MADAFDWNNIQEIEICFGKFSSKGNADKYEDLNNAFSQYLENIDGLFTTDANDADRPKSLAHNPVTMLKEIIFNTIMGIIPSKKQTEINKGHFSNNNNIQSGPQVVERQILQTNRESKQGGYKEQTDERYWEHKPNRRHLPTII
eukprot:jgi/Psemu1/3878/gm1.3878_g